MLSQRKETIESGKMTTAAELANQAISRAKALDKWIVTLPLPDGFRFNGPVPFDMKIYDNIAEITVWAVTQQEATQRAEVYIEGCK